MPEKNSRKNTLTSSILGNIPHTLMANICELTGKRPMSGHKVSHANNKTKRKFYPNLKKVSLKSELLNKNVSLKISTRALKAVDFRGGLDQFLIRAKNKNLAPRIKKIKKALMVKNKTKAN
jgi:large subunit ribosomal protein L28